MLHRKIGRTEWDRRQRGSHDSVVTLPGQRQKCHASWKILQRKGSGRSSSGISEKNSQHTCMRLCAWSNDSIKREDIRKSNKCLLCFRNAFFYFRKFIFFFLIRSDADWFFFFKSNNIEQDALNEELAIRDVVIFARLMLQFRGTLKDLCLKDCFSGPTIVDYTLVGT